MWGQAKFTEFLHRHYFQKSITKINSMFNGDLIKIVQSIVKGKFCIVFIFAVGKYEFYSKIKYQKCIDRLSNAPRHMEDPLYYFIMSRIRSQKRILVEGALNGATVSGLNPVYSP